MTPPITREDWCRHVEAKWEEIKLRFLELVPFYVNNVITKEMVQEKILAGKKFGPLDLEAMNFPAELLEELIDGLAYLSGGDLQDGS